MKTLAMTDDGDLDFLVGTVEGDDEIIQSIVLELKSGLTEWFEDVNYGTDQEVFTDKPHPQEIAAEVARVISNEPRVELDGAVTVNFESASRTANVFFTVRKVENDELLNMEVSV